MQSPKATLNRPSTAHIEAVRMYPHAKWPGEITGETLVLQKYGGWTSQEGSSLLNTEH